MGDNHQITVKQTPITIKPHLKYEGEYELSLNGPGSSSIVISVLPEASDYHGGINISTTGTISPGKARQVIRMIEMAIDIYEQKIVVARKK